jgi:hypothetical protein
MAPNPVIIPASELAKKKKAPPARLVGVDTVYYQSRKAGNPSQFTLRFTRNLTTDEQPYIRRQKMDRDSNGVEIDTGWLGKEVGLLVVENCSQSLLEICRGDCTCMQLPPSESCRFVPVLPLNIRAAFGGEVDIEFVVYAFPR